MKKGNSLLSIFKNGCVIFTIISMGTYIAGYIIGGENKEFIPTLKWIILFFVFSLLLACANYILKSQKFSKTLRLLFHFIATAALYFVTVVLCGGFISSGAQTLIAFTLFIILYSIFAIIYAVATKTKKKKKNKKEEYKSVFN